MCTSAIRAHICGPPSRLYSLEIILGSRDTTPRSLIRHRTYSTLLLITFLAPYDLPQCANSNVQRNRTSDFAAGILPVPSGYWSIFALISADKFRVRICQASHWAPPTPTGTEPPCPGCGERSFLQSQARSPTSTAATLCDSRHPRRTSTKL
jgi:hypothetical protein